MKESTFKIMMAIFAGLAAAMIIGIFRRVPAFGGEWLFPVAFGFIEFVRTENERINHD